MPLVVLAFNPGSNSLKFDLVETDPDLPCAGDGRKLLSGVVDHIGKRTKLVVERGGETVEEREGEFPDFAAAAREALRSLEKFEAPELAAVRVVHGGSAFDHAVRVDDRVRDEIATRQVLAPLHNANSLAILQVLRDERPDLPAAAAFDTAFHRTLPEHAWRYPIERELADRHGVRKYGFHGLSHRFLLERYAQLTGQQPEEASIVTTHLESGASVCAIQNGRSIDTSMGLTPLEGLMMGTRSGSVDPAVVTYLAREAGMSAEEALEALEKRSGLLGVSGISLDTRVLRERGDAASRLALRMFGYRVRLFVGAYLAALGEAQAVVFGGGIGENTPEVRAEAAGGLAGWGLKLDAGLNDRTVDGDVRISVDCSRLAAWVIHVEEGMQLALECARAASA